MARVCMLGVGIPAFISSSRHAGPGLRSAHFAEAAAACGHDVLLLCVMPGGEELPEPSDRATPGGGRIRTLLVEESDLETSVASEVARFGPEALVAATAYASSLATRLRLDVPFWADIFGDFMAEAQAKASRLGGDGPLVHFWRMLGPVLERADRFSAVSSAQAHALVGQLGLAGRLSSRTAGERLVHVVPCAASVKVNGHVHGSAAPALRGERLPAGAFVVLWSGGFNTWCDTETLFAGLEQAMARDERIHLVCTGAEIEGHDEVTYKGFRANVDASRFRSRFHLCGWVPSELLPAYYREADLGISIELELYERELGSENRVVCWAAAGLPCVTTARSELGRTLVERGLALGARPADPASVADVILSVAQEPGHLSAMGEACRRYAAEELHPAVTAAPLLEWLSDPCRAGDSAGDRALSVGLFSEPGATVHLLEAYLAHLSLPQVAYRSTRWLWRRVRRSLPG